MRPLTRLQRADWSRVPPYMHHSLERWVFDGDPPQPRFLQAMLANDLRGTFAVANYHEQSALPDLIRFLAEHFPAECWGSAAALVDWQRLGGLSGIAKAEMRYE